MKAALLIAHSICCCLCVTAAAEEIPKFYGMGEAGFSVAFRVAAEADLQADYLTWKEQFDIGVGEVRDGVLHSKLFSYDELAHYWETQAANKFVCITLSKNKLSKEEKDKLVSRLSEYLFKCGVRRVRIHQGEGWGVGVLFDQERKQKPVTR